MNSYMGEIDRRWLAAGSINILVPDAEEWEKKCVNQDDCKVAAAAVVVVVVRAGSA